MAENGKHWYVVRAISGKEKKVRDYIEDEISARVSLIMSLKCLSQPRKFTRSEMVKRSPKKEAFSPVIY